MQLQSSQGSGSLIEEKEAAWHFLSSGGLVSDLQRQGLQGAGLGFPLQPHFRMDS